MIKVIEGLTIIGFLLFVIAASVVTLSLFSDQTPDSGMLYVPLTIAAVGALAIILKQAYKIGERLRRIDHDLIDMEKIETESAPVIEKYRLNDDLTLIVEGKRLSNLKEVMRVTKIVSSNGLVASAPYIQDFLQPLYNFANRQDILNVGYEEVDVKSWQKRKVGLTYKDEANFLFSLSDNCLFEFIKLEENGATHEYYRWECGAIYLAATAILRRFPPAPQETNEVEQKSPTHVKTNRKIVTDTVAKMLDGSREFSAKRSKKTQVPTEAEAEQ
jgi:hypothetical protein